MYLLCKSIYITHPGTLLDIITFMDFNDIFSFFATMMLVFLKSNLTGFQMDWTILSFLNEVFVLASTSYFENAVCMCVAQKNAMQNKNLRVEMQCKK